MPRAVAVATTDGSVPQASCLMVFDGIRVEIAIYMVWLLARRCVTSGQALERLAEIFPFLGTDILGINLRFF